MNAPPSTSSTQHVAENTASFQPHLLITQLLEIPFHIPNTFIKVKYRYRNKVYKCRSGLLNVYGGMVEQQRVHSSGDSRATALRSHHQERVIYAVPLPQTIRLAIHQKTRILEPLFIHCKIRSKNKKKALKKIGEVCINLSEYANDKDSVSRRYLLHKCKMNALLCVSVSMQQVSGDKFFRCPREDSFYARDKTTMDSMDNLDGASKGKGEAAGSGANASNSSILISESSSLNQSFDFEQFSATGARISAASSNILHRNSSALLVESLISETLGNSPQKNDTKDAADAHNSSLNLSALSMDIEMSNKHSSKHKTVPSGHSEDGHGEMDMFSDYTASTTMSPPLYDSIIGTIRSLED